MTTDEQRRWLRDGIRRGHTGLLDSAGVPPSLTQRIASAPKADRETFADLLTGGAMNVDVKSGPNRMVMCIAYDAPRDQYALIVSSGDKAEVIGTISAELATDRLAWKTWLSTVVIVAANRLATMLEEGA